MDKVMRAIKMLLVALAFGLWVDPGMGAQHRGDSATVVNWPLHNLDLAGSRYSTVDQINTGNVRSLTPRWLFQYGIIDGVNRTPRSLSMARCTSRIRGVGCMP
jgi:hypothetical protein